MARDRESRRQSRQRPGPRVNQVKLELAAELRVCCLDWQEISRTTGIPYKTLMRWQARPEWREAIDRLRAEQLNLLRLGRRVLAKKLSAGLRASHNAKGAVELAERLERMQTDRRNGDGEYPTPATPVDQTPAVFVVPMPDRGLESKPIHEVLKQAAPGEHKKAVTTTKQSPKRRRVVTEDE